MPKHLTSSPPRCLIRLTMTLKILIKDLAILWPIGLRSLHYPVTLLTQKAKNKDPLVPSLLDSQTYKKLTLLIHLRTNYALLVVEGKTV